MSRAKSTVLQVEELEAREVPAILYAVNSNNSLFTFNSASPGVLLSRLPISGLLAGERITDLAVRSGNNGLYGRSDQNHLYLISSVTGFALRVGGTTIPANSPNVGMNYNPTTNQLQFVSNFDQNFTMNPNLGTVTSFGIPLAYRSGDFFQGTPPRITSLGFTNRIPLASVTTLYGIDHFHNTLVRIGNPSPVDGQVSTVGALGFDVRPNVGFDIDPITSVGYATVQVPGVAFSFFCTVNLATGAASVIGPVGPNRLINDIAVAIGGNIISPPTTVPPITGIFVPPSTPTLPPVPTAPLFTPSAQLFAPIFDVSSPLAPSLVQPTSGSLFAPLVVPTVPSTTFFAGTGTNTFFAEPGTSMFSSTIGF